MNIALIMMGGTGERFGAAIPKQFIEVDSKPPLFTYLLGAYEEYENVDSIYIVCHKAWIDFTQSWAAKIGTKKLKSIVSGGKCRSQSVQFGLYEIAKSASESDVILIHDTTHPFLDTKNTLLCIDIARSEGAAALVGTCFDTMYEIAQDGYVKQTIDRARTVSATSPECFRLDVALEMYKDKTEDELAAMTCAGAMLASQGKPLRAIRTSMLNLKVTLHEDMEVFSKLVHGYYYE